MRSSVSQRSEQLRSGVLPPPNGVNSPYVGYDATRESCQEWLRTYRLSDGGKDGGAGVYRLSRQQLQRWHYVDGLSPTALQDRYRSECGVYANRGSLIKWLKVISE